MKILTIACLLLATVTHGAEISYIASNRVIQVSGFTDERPATLDDVLAADRKQGWGVISYTPSNDTFRVNASLWIGNSNDFGTFFQVGRPDRQNETLVIKGDVWVAPPQSSRRRPGDKRFMIVNRLTLGDPTNTAIRPSLRFDNSKPLEFGLMVGARNQLGGDLYLYRARVAPLIPDKDHALRGFAYENAKTGFCGGWYAHDLVLVDSTISWIGQQLYLGATAPPYTRAQDSHCRFEGTTFEHLGYVCLNPIYLSWTYPFPPTVFARCIFRDVKAVSIPGAMTFVNCVFEDNERNFDFFSAADHRGWTMIDCRLQPGRQPDRIPMAVIKPEVAVRTKCPTNPPTIDQHVLVCQVTDRRERPVPHAIVSVDCEEMPAAVARAIAVTGDDGRTPSDAFQNGLLITRSYWIPTSEPTVQTKRYFAYRITVEAARFKRKTVALGSDCEIPRPVKISMEKE